MILTLVWGINSSKNMTKHLCWKTYLQNSSFISSTAEFMRSWESTGVYHHHTWKLSHSPWNYNLRSSTDLVAAQNPWREQGAHSCPLTSWPSTKGSTVTLFHTRCLHAQPCPLSFTRWTRSPGTMFLCLFNSCFQPSTVWNILLQCENSPVSSAQGRPLDPCPAPAANASLGPCYTWWKSSLGCQSSC